MTTVFAATPTVVTANVAELAPAGTVTVAGRLTLRLFDDRVTMAPPAGAGPVRKAVPVAPLPPINVDGETKMLCILIGVIVNTVLTVVPESVAEMVAAV